ncbi:unnamed protein product [Discula destructiva]
MAWNRNVCCLARLSTIALHALGALGRSSGSTGLHWPQDRVLPLFPTAARTIDAANITLVTSEERILLISLQGIVNRQQPRVYLYWNDFDPNQFSNRNLPEEAFARRYWLEELRGAGYELNILTSDPLELVTKYQSELNGAVLFDPDVPDTINLATTVAGIHGGVVATEDLATRWQLPVLQDFRGKFEDKFAVYEYGLAEVYPKVTNRLLTAINPVWLYKAPNVTWTTLLEATERTENRTTPRFYPVEIPSDLIGNSSSVYVRFSDAFDDTGYGPSVYHVMATTDNNNRTLASFDTTGDDEQKYLWFDEGSAIDNTPPAQRDDGVTGVWRYADRTSSFTYRFILPPTSRSLHLSINMSNEFEVAATIDDPRVTLVNSYFRDYIAATAAPNIWLSPTRPRERALFQRILAYFAPDSVYMGWFPEGDEQRGVTLTAEASVSVLAADFFTAASFQAGLPSSSNKTKVALRKRAPGISPAGDGHAAAQPLSRTNSTTKKIYVNMVWPEGDNIQYCQSRMREMWDDEARGEVPQGWTISPVLRDTSPNILDYYETTATANDFLITGPNGAGYTYPIPWPADDLQRFLDRSGLYMRDTGLEALVWVYNRVNTTDVSCAEIPDVIQGYEDAVGPGLLGLLCNFAPPNAPGTDPFADGRLDVNFTASGMPVSPIVGLDNEGQGVATLRNISAAWNATAPLWLTAATAAFAMKPVNVSSIASQLGPEFEILRPDVFYKRLREAHAQGRVGNTDRRHRT